MRWHPLTVLIPTVLDGGFSHATSILPRYDSEEITVDSSKHESQFFTFITRPDLDAPRYSITLHNSSALAPGYFFIAPYGIVEQKDNSKAYVAPHIYDSITGELIWSGAAMFDRYNTFDFKVSDVGGTDMLTALYPHGSGAVMINRHYEVVEEVYVGVSAVTTNMHEFQVLNTEKGTRGLYLTKERKRASRDISAGVGYEGECFVEFNGFEERDVETGEVVFSWTAEGRIALEESVMWHNGRGRHCDGDVAWDYLHLNSVTLLPDGDYLLSARRTYALYKISHKDGSILWRLGGKNSSFTMNNLHFSGQHDARYLSSNATHLIISILDNASGPGYPKTTNPYSRGLIISLNTQTMTAEEVIEYPHPKRNLADGRGNLQFLPNGNAFASWRDNAQLSEYTAYGTLIAEAELPSGLKTYRGYKAEWVGLPRWRPDVHSQNLILDGEVCTVVHVSWNGATEVATWDLYQADSGELGELLISARHTGFETRLVHHGHVPHLIVVGVDAQGDELGRSSVISTRDADDTSSAATSEEVKWLKKNMHSWILKQRWGDWLKELIHDPFYVFVGGVAVCIAVGLLAWCSWKAWKRKLCCGRRKEEAAYAVLPDNEEEDEGFSDVDEK